MIEAGLSLFVFATAGVLSFGQAWALRANNLRALRLFAVWVAACLTMLAIASLIYGLGQAPEQSRDRAIDAILVIGGVVAFIALAAGAIRRAAVRKAPDLVQGAMALAGIHFAVVFFGGAVGLLVLALWVLAGANW